MKKILLKISGELFSDLKQSINLKKVADVAHHIAAVNRHGFKIGVVVGGGNIFRGRQIRKREIQEVTGHYMGMVATIINCLALRDALLKIKCPAKIISALPLKVAGMETKLSRANLSSKDLIIFAGGTGKPYVTTDTAAVKRALEMKADILLKGTKVDGIYNTDPIKNKHAKKYSHLSHSQYLKEKLQVMDNGAVALAQKNNLPIYVFRWQNGDFLKVVSGHGQGSLIQ